MSSAYREQHVGQRCAWCDDLAVSMCPRCERPTCTSHEPTQDARCHDCERDYDQAVQDRRDLADELARYTGTEEDAPERLKPYLDSKPSFPAKAGLVSTVIAAVIAGTWFGLGLGFMIFMSALVASGALGLLLRHAEAKPRKLAVDEDETKHRRAFLREKQRSLLPSARSGD